MGSLEREGRCSGGLNGGRHANLRGVRLTKCVAPIVSGFAPK